jgi:hypothetical protein
MTSIEERMKTKEELAEQYADKKHHILNKVHKQWSAEDFLAGWDACNAVITNNRYFPGKWLCTYHANKVTKEGRMKRKYKI